MDDAPGAGAGRRLRTVQRAAPGAAADVPEPAVHAAGPARARGRDQACPPRRVDATALAGAEPVGRIVDRAAAGARPASAAPPRAPAPRRADLALDRADARAGRARPGQRDRLGRGGRRVGAGRPPHGDRVGRVHLGADPGAGRSDVLQQLGSVSAKAAGLRGAGEDIDAIRREQGALGSLPGGDWSRREFPPIPEPRP